MDRTYFDIKKNTPIYLYGASTLGISAAGLLLKNGFNLRGVIDRRAKELEYEGFEVITVEEFYGRPDYKEVVVIICFNNGNLHETVAAELFSMGVKKMLYLPMKKGRTLEDRHIRRVAWRDMTSEAHIEISEIPECTSLDFGDYLTANLRVIRRTEGKVTFYCPAEFIHSQTRKVQLETAALPIASGIDGFAKYQDAPIEGMEHYLELFDCLSGKRQDAPLYLSLMRGDDEDAQKKLLEDRRALYFEYEESFRFDPFFFADAPAAAAFNEKGYINIIDGMHRIIYLYTKGCTEMPVMMSASEFEKFENYLSKIKG